MSEFDNILDERSKVLLKGLQKPLPIDSIDFRIQSINKGGYATVLAYKDARVDMNRLDEVVGALNWKREHQGDYCTVSIFNSNTGEWVSKQDIGTQSNTEKEKGLASDSFKRACFNWGIGRELYDYPIISVKLNPDEVDMKGAKPRATFSLNIRAWKWFTQFTDGKITYLACKDTTGKKRFEWGTYKAEVKL